MSGTPITFYNGTSDDLKIQTPSGTSITTFPATDKFTGGDYTINGKYKLNGDSLKKLIGERSYLNIDFEPNLVVKDPVSQSTYGPNNTVAYSAHLDNTWILIISMDKEKAIACTADQGWVEQKYSDFITKHSMIMWIVLIILVLFIALVLIGVVYLVKKKKFMH